MQLYLPGGYFHAVCKFTGGALPHGAAFTFDGQITGTYTSAPTIGAQIKALLTEAAGGGIAGGPYQSGSSTWSNSITFQEILVKLGPMDTGASAVTPVGFTPTGGVGDADAPNVAALIQKSTAIGGKKGHGRMFIPGLTEADTVTGGTIASAVLTTEQTRWTRFYSQMVASGLPLVLAHRFGTYTKKDGTVVTVPQRTPDAVLALNLAAQVATQRRRNRR